MRSEFDVGFWGNRLTRGRFNGNIREDDTRANEERAGNFGTRRDNKVTIFKRQQEME